MIDGLVLNVHVFGLPNWLFSIIFRYLLMLEAVFLVLQLLTKRKFIQTLVQRIVEGVLWTE